MFLFEFGPFIIAATLLVLASLASDIPWFESAFPNSHVGIYVCLAFVALLSFVLRLTQRQSVVETVVRNLDAAAREAIEHIDPEIESMSMSDAFKRGLGPLGTHDHIRIFGITSRFVSQQLSSEEAKAERLSLMVAGNTADDPRMSASDKLEDEVQIALEYSWASRVRNGYIRKLCVRQYEFFPTEWYVIFDDRLMILGTYVFDPKAVGCAAPFTTSVMVVHSSGAGRELIGSKIEAFDRLMSCDSKRVGNGPFDGEYRLKGDRVKHRVNGGKWRDMPGISQTWPV